MKKVVTGVIILLASTQLFAQKDTSKVEQYAEIIVTPRLLSAKVTIDIDYGEERSIWKDNRIKDEEGRLKKFNTTVDALNYMGRTGWQLVNAFPYSTGGTSFVYHYVFKKSFSRSEVVQ